MSNYKVVALYDLFMESPAGTLPLGVRHSIGGNPPKVKRYYTNKEEADLAAEEWTIYYNKQRKILDQNAESRRKTK